MMNPDAGSKAKGTDALPQTRSTAQQVVYWLILVSLVVAVAVMGAWWVAEDLPVTPSTSFICMFATIGVWVTVYRLLVLGIKQLVRGRLEKRRSS